MPWKETDAMSEKREFIKAVMKKEETFKDICRKYGISEKTGYKWWNRFQEMGIAGLSEETRAPKRSPNMLDSDTTAELLGIRFKHPTWGAKKLQVLYERNHRGEEIPSISSITRILGKAGQIKRRRVKHAKVRTKRLKQQLKAEAPNDVWCIDFKGWWMSDGERCEPFTVRDKYSRYVLCARLMRTKSAEAVKAVMQELFREYGLPKAIHSDNGSPFAANNGVLGLTTLSAWWITLGIIPDRSEEGRPGQNGSLERMHGDMAKEIEGQHIPGGIRANQVLLDEWRKEYNEIRPNEAIGQKTPFELYRRSDEKYTGDYERIDYGFGIEPRKVSSGGYISYHKHRIMVGRAFQGLTLGLRPEERGEGYGVYLAEFYLGKLDVMNESFIAYEGEESTEEEKEG